MISCPIVNSARAHECLYRRVTPHTTSRRHAQTLIELPYRYAHTCIIRQSITHFLLLALQLVWVVALRGELVGAVDGGGLRARRLLAVLVGDPASDFLGVRRADLFDLLLVVGVGRCKPFSALRCFMPISQHLLCAAASGNTRLFEKKRVRNWWTRY